MSNSESAHTSFMYTSLKLFSLLTLAMCFGETSTVVHAQTGENIVAVVKGRRITQKEVDDSVVSQIFPLQQQIHALRKIALENFILRTILEDEAGKKGISAAELRKQLTAGKVEVPVSQAEQIYLENATTFAAMSPDEAKERIRLDLETQARMRNYREALLKLKEIAGVQLFLEEPRLPSAVVGDTAPSTGAPKALITIAEFSDFECAYCKQAHRTLKQVLKHYATDVRLVFKHLPLGIHPQAFASARAAFCAGEQGFFWEYHDALFATETLSPESFRQIAMRLRLNLDKFKTCFDSESSTAAVLKDVQEARRMGITGTPAFIINGKLFRGALSFEEFKRIIEREMNSSQPASSNN